MVNRYMKIDRAKQHQIKVNEKGYTLQDKINTGMQKRKIGIKFKSDFLGKNCLPNRKPAQWLKQTLL